MKTKLTPVQEVKKINKVSNFEAIALAEQKQKMNEKLEAITVKFELTAADFALLLRLAVEELESLEPAAPTQDSKRAYLADEAKRRATGKASRSYELFLCSFKSSARVRSKLISKGKISEADFLLDQAQRTVAKLVKLDSAHSDKMKKK